MRIWLNGKIVQQKLALRSANPDDDQALIEFGQGANVFLVEVLQATGGWALYFRLEDSQGRPVLMDADGNLQPQEEPAKAGS